jgi:PAS domain S-box-containing protein
LGTVFLDIVHPDDEERVRNEFYSYMRRRQSGRIDYRCRHAEGHYLYMETVGSWLVDNNKVTSIILISRDITKRKLAETALRQSEEKFSKIFRFSPDTIAISTLDDGRYVEVNDAFTQLTGYERYEALGHTAFELGIWVDAADRDYFTNLLKNHGSVSGLELRFRVKSGEIITTLVSGEIIEMDGRLHLLVIVKDITDRKRLEEILRLSEERFSKAFNASPLLMAITTFKGGRFIDINQSFCQVFGYSREELIGHTSSELGMWKKASDRHLILQAITDYGSFTDLELNFVTKSGKIIVGLCSGESIEIGGEVCLLFIIMDITERKQMEMEIARLDRMNMVGQIAASIGHEIRNPMTTVRGFLQVLNNKEKYAEDHEIINLMIEEIDRANAIIKEFLSLAKDKLIEPKLQDINSVISSMLPLIHADAVAQDKNIQVRLENVPELLLDEKEIRQLLLNLIRNGLEAMSPGKTLSITTFIQGQNVILSIQDQGHGMTEEVLQKLGTPFFTTKEDGTGLGLAVCYVIARRHGAAVDIDTSPSGTRFDIKFPAGNMQSYES